jgi:hypothetical protein
MRKEGSELRVREGFRTMPAGRQASRMTYDVVRKLRKLQIVKFFYGKSCLAYQFAKQAGTEFTVLRNG